MSSSPSFITDSRRHRSLTLSICSGDRGSQCAAPRAFLEGQLQACMESGRSEVLGVFLFFSSCCLSDRWPNNLEIEKVQSDNATKHNC